MTLCPRSSGLIETHLRRTTALGSALLAGHTKKLFGWDLNDPKTLGDVNTAGQTVFQSKISDEDRGERYDGWNRASVVTVPADDLRLTNVMI